MSDYFGSRRNEIDQFLSGLSEASSAPEILREPLEAAALSRGKRIRGILALAAGEACGVAPARLVSTAAAFEMIHACSLVLDDLPSMDNATLRRGEPALHRKFGEDLAILTAVGLLNHSYGLLAEAHESLHPRRWSLAQIIARVVSAVGWNGSIGGEAVDLHSESAALDFRTLEYIHSRKTGTLFVAAASVAGMLANASPLILSQLEAFAKNLGLAFQIKDDILDETADSQTLGKDAGQDAHRQTFVKLAGVDGAEVLAAELIETSLAAISPMGRKGERLRELALMVRDRTR